MEDFLKNIWQEWHISNNHFMSENFWDMFDRFHPKDGISFRSMWNEKRQSRQPQKPKDIFTFLVEHDISITWEIIRHVVHKRSRNFHMEMSRLDDEFNVPWEVLRASLDIIQDHIFYSQCELELREHNDQVDTRATRPALTTEVFKRIKWDVEEHTLTQNYKQNESIKLLSEPPLLSWARKNMRQGMMQIWKLVEKQWKAERVVANVPVWLAMIDSPIDINRFIESQAQLEELHPNIGWDLKYPNIERKIIWAYSNPYIPFLLLKTCDHVDFIICIQVYPAKHIVTVIVRKHKHAVERCIEFLKKTDIKWDTDLQGIQEYLECLSITLS